MISPMIRYAAKRILSATAPDTIVVAVTANPAWKRKNAISQGLVISANANPVVPNHPLIEAPNINANPNSQNMPSERQKSAKFFAATLILFLVRTRPLSSDEKPACMNMTNAAHIRIQAISSASAVVIRLFIAYGIMKVAPVEGGHDAINIIQCEWDFKDWNRAKLRGGFKWIRNRCGRKIADSREAFRTNLGHFDLRR